MFDSGKFSRDLKIQKLNYKENLEVDIKLIKRHIDFLARYDTELLDSESKKLAFWINTYNGLTNYWIIQKKIKTKVLEYLPFFIIPKVKIGNFRFSLDNIEHGILRRNKKLPRPPFYQFFFNDSRKSLMVEKLDYRIHFALNCGANSCPPIAFYDSENIDSQLQLAEDSFVENEFIVDHKNKSITCSKIFSMYRNDFNSIYLNDPKFSDYKEHIKPYDWSI